MDTFEKRLVGFGIIAITTLSILTILASVNQVQAPSGRRWPVFSGMDLPLVNILDQNGYYATLSCKVTTFDNDAYTYTLSCGDAPTVVQIGK